MEQVIIGVDPHKLSATIEVVDQREKVLGSGRFTTDKSGFAAMRKYVSQWPDREWAVEGSLGVGRPRVEGHRRLRGPGPVRGPAYLRGAA